ncbi:DUF397 domain-containing protein [Amycolatopsis aidingensis]|uniref:DUF397 domain-containing protein n=1 Tax=Amycolatopsis aidingensis TaxID=2842453 RepID=UPI0038CC1734
MPADLTDAIWHTSSYSNGGGNECVEVAMLEDGAAVRDSKCPGVASWSSGRKPGTRFARSCVPEQQTRARGEQTRARGGQTRGQGSRMPGKRAASSVRVSCTEVC